MNPITPKHRARFTRWICRKGIDPNGRIPWYLKPAMHLLFSPDLYIYLCAHPVWFEPKHRTDLVVILAGMVAGKETQ